MSNAIDSKLQELEEQHRKLLMEPGLARTPKFSNITLDLSDRFKAYAKPVLMEPVFEDLFNKLSAYKLRINAGDAWNYETFMRIMNRQSQPLDFQKTLDKLVKQYKIPEGHIFIKEQSVAGELFPTKAIYLSRYALYLVSKEMLHHCKSWQYAFGLSDGNETKSEFEYESRVAFARYFFAFPETDCDDLIKTFWDWTRGDRLKRNYNTTLTRLNHTVRGFYGTNADWRIENDFRNKYVFNTLFGKMGNIDGTKYPITFQSMYDGALRRFHYRMVDNRWCRHDEIAPKIPGSMIAPHIMLFLIRHMNEFCDATYNKEKQQKIKEWRHSHIGNGAENGHTISTPESMKQNHAVAPERMKFSDLELLAMEYFGNIRIGIEKSNEAFNAPFFVDKSSSKCYKLIKEIEFGNGHRNENGRENPGVLDFFKSQTLFSSREMFYYTSRLELSEQLAKLKSEYDANPNDQLALKMSFCLADIERANTNLYGFNYTGFSEIPKIEFTNERKQMKKETAPMPQFTEMEFSISESKIPRGVRFTRKESSSTPGKSYVIFDPNGNLESVNPLVAEPTVLDKDGNPKNADANFDMHSFLLESDDLTLDEQITQAKRLVALGVVNMVVFSGNKSLHMRVTMTDKQKPKTREERKWLFHHIIQKYDIRGMDLVTYNNGRMIRTPGAMREKSDGTTVEQKLMHMSSAMLNISWRPIYNAEMKLFAQQTAFRTEYSGAKSTIDTFMTKYARKHNISISFESGTGHNTGCTLIGAAIRAGFSESEITSWLQRNCERYKELAPNWASLFKKSRTR